MQTIIIVACLVAVAVAAPQQAFQQVQNHTAVFVTKEQLSDNNSLHPTHFSFEQSDGTFRDETAEFQFNERAARSEGEESDVGFRVTGSYGWTDPTNGKTYTITYVADETGFHPEGDHIPKA